MNGYIYSQTNVDSLLVSLETATRDSITFRKYLSYAQDMEGKNAEAGITICQWIINNNTNNPNPICLVMAYYTIGRLYLTIDAFEEADKYLSTALIGAKHFKFYRYESAVYSCYGTLYSNNKQYYKAQEYYLKGIEIDKKNNDLYQLSTAYINLAALVYETKIESKLSLNINPSKVDIDSCLIYIRAGEKCNSVTQDPVLSVFILDLKGLAYLETKNCDSAIVFLIESNQLIKKNNIDYYLPYNLEYIGRYYSRMNQLDGALKSFLEALNIAKEQMAGMSIYNLYEEIATTYQKKGDYKKAFEYTKLHKEAYDSYTNANTTIKINNNITQSRLKGKERELQDINIQKSLSDSLLIKEKETKRVIVIAAVLLLIFTTILIVVAINLSKAIKAKKASYLKLQERNIEIQQKSELLLKLSKEITKYQTQMNPHFIFNALNSIQGLVVNNEKKKTLDHLMVFSKLMRQTLNNSNEESISLKKEFEYLNLYVNFERQRFSNYIDFQIKSVADEEDIYIPPMMIQPFIENALKHAGLNSVEDAKISLSLSISDEILKISICDNGKGITKSMEEIIQNSHAISIVKSRIKLLFENEGRIYNNLHFSMLSIPEIDRGTLITINIPLITKF